MTANDLRVHTVSGNIDIGGMQIDSEASFKTTSGDIKIIESQSGELITQNVSGNTILTDTQITGSAACKATSGDIKLNRVDMDSFEAKTVSGNITGSPLSPKLFSAQSNSGRVKVPSAVSGNAQAGLCILTTTSGDIRMEIHQ